MVSINDFVYSFEFGIGRIDKVENDKLSISFPHGMEEVSISEVNLLSNVIFKHLEHENFTYYFDAATLKRGHKYYLENRVQNVHGTSNRLGCIVDGSDVYSVSISFSENTIRTHCTCPVGLDCKHSAALLYYVSSYIEKLKPASTTKQSFASIDFELQQALDSISDSKQNSHDYVKNLLHFSKIFQTITQEDLKGIISYIQERYRNRFYQMNTFKRFIACNDRVYTNVMNDLSFVSGPFLEEIRSERRSLETFLRKARGYEYLRGYDIRIIVLYYISNGLYEDLIYTLFERSRVNELEYYLPTLLRSVEDPRKFLELYKDFCLKYRDLFEVNEVFLEKLSPKEKIEFYKELKIQIPLSMLNELTYSEQLEVLLHQDLTKDFAQSILDKIYSYLSNDYDKTVQLLFVIGDSIPSIRKRVIEVLETLEDTELLVAFLSRKSKGMDYSKNSLYRYNTLYYSMNETEAHVYIEYFLVIDTHKYYITSSMDGVVTEELKEPYMLSLVERFLSNPEYIEDYQAITNKVLEKQKEKKKKEYKEAIRQFESTIMDEEFVVSDREKISLEVSIRYDEGARVSFRVAKDKYYIVKDAIEFLEAIKDHVTLQYGKGLEFNHYIENFDTESKDVLSYLLSLPFSSFDSFMRKELILTDDIFEGLLFRLKNHTILYHNQETLVALDEVTPEVYLTKDYELKSNLINYEVISLNHIFLYDEKNHVIHLVQGTKRENQFYEFVYNHEGMNVSLIQKEFMDSIYSRFHSKIQIDSSIQDAFYCKGVLISIYFDYQDKVLSYKTTYTVEDKVVAFEDITSEVDKSKVRSFFHYIESIGFTEAMVNDDNIIYQFFSMDFSYLRSIATVYLSDSIKSKTIEHFTAPTIRIQYESNMLEAFLEQSDYSDEELEHILYSIRRKKKYVILGNDRIVDLDNLESKELLDVVDDLKLDTKCLQQKTQRPIYQAFKALAHSSIHLDDELSNMLFEISNYKNANLELPKMNATLRGYQKEGYYWLKTLSKYHLGGILADDMGLGKTIEIITLLASDSTALPSLVVCPTSLIFNWIHEIEKFSDMKAVKIYGSIEYRENLISSIGKEKVIYITSYDSLRNDENLYKDICFQYMILDEAQAIKNVSAIKSQSVKQIQSRYRFAMTGTPIENNILDLWSIFDFIMPEYFLPIQEFKRKYEANPTYLENISKKSAPFILRRTKEEVLKDLPPKYERVLSATMSESQRKIYDALCYDAKMHMESGASAFEMLPFFMRLRQICVSPHLFMDDYLGTSGKIDIVENILKEYIPLGHRILLFSSFVEALNLVEDVLKKNQIEYMKITGSTSAKDRLDYVNQFNKEDRIKVFLISLKAGGTGLNLTGADTVIHLDPWWNLSAENQATDRSYRIGQKKNVEVIKLVCEDSIEERVIELQNRKKDLIDKVIRNDDSLIRGLSREDIKFILE